MTSINLEIGGTPLRIACDRRIMRRLRARYRQFLVTDEAPLGFVVQPPTVRNRRHVLLDRCGFRLGSASNPRHVAAMLDSHLSALLPLASSQARFRVRAVLDAEGVALCFFPVLFVPLSAVEQLQSTGYDVLDRLAVEIESGSGCMVRRLDPLDEIRGRSAGLDTAAIDRLVLPRTNQPLSPTRMEAAAVLCSEAIAGDRGDILDAAIAVVKQASVDTVQVTVANDLARVFPAR